VNALLEVGLSNAVQAAVLVPAAALVGRCLRRRPAVVHVLWVLVLLKLVTPSLVHLEVPWTASAVEPTTIAALPAEVPPADTTLPAATTVEPTHAVTPAAAPISWRPFVVTIWLTGAGVSWGLALWRILQFRRLLRAGTPDHELRDRVAPLAEHLGLRRVPEVWLVPARISPMLWAPGRHARLLLPAELWDELAVEQQDAVLAHELAHLRRGDPWVRRLELLIGGLYWWHPAVWWARREIEAAEEQCCDAWVAWALPGSGEAYAAALLSTVTYLSGRRPPLPAGASGVGHVRTLKRRLAMIVNGTTTGAAATVLPRMVLLIGAVGLLWLPTWAHGDPQDRPRPSTPKTERLPTPKPTTPQAEPTPPAVPRPIPSKPVGDATAAGGTVQLARSMTLSPAVAGLLTNIRVEAGATVKRGDVLVELDDRRAKLELERAQAKVQGLKEKFEMMAKAAEVSGAGRTSETKNAEMEFRVAQADMELARLALEGTRIVAPMDGTILRWQVPVGQNVAAGQALGELADLSRVMAIVNLPPREVSRIAVGRRCRIRAQGLEDTYQGSVGRIDPVVDPKTGTIRVYVTIDPPEKGDLPRPGLLVEVEFAPKE
jgi:RND family efflux transporter MFP subunit